MNPAKSTILFFLLLIIAACAKDDPAPAEEKPLKGINMF